MKITKLYTLNQFVDLIEKQIKEHEQGLQCFLEFQLDKYYLIPRYNDFLKQPITKDMFVNPFDKSLPEWHEAEKKRIFKNHDKVYLDNVYPDCACIKNGGVIPFDFTLNNLAIASNGELDIEIEI